LGSSRALIAWTCRAALARVEQGGLARGAPFWLYLLLYGVARVLLDPLRADGRPERFLGLSHQQGLALALVAVALACAWLTRERGRPRAESSFA
jgi:prolipoprotein diacylglyceryltransferase